MQRTVKSTLLTYAVNELDEQGNISARVATVEVAETDPAKALKKAFKAVGFFTPLKSEIRERRWVMDDEIFFKYAKPVEPAVNA